MLKQGLAVIVVALLLAGFGSALARGDDPPKARDEQLEGDWELVSAVRDGKDLPIVGSGKPTFTIKGNRTSSHVGDKVVEESIVVDASKSPKTIDSALVGDSDPERVKHGIYEIKDDMLRICIGPPPKERPTDFSPKEGSGYSVIVFKRVKK